MKEMAKKVLVILVFVVMMGYLLVSALLDLSNKKDLHMLNIVYGVEIMEVEHTINGLIPVGKDHYFVGIEENTQNAYVIHAPKNWAKNNFPEIVDENSYQQAQPVLITALAKKVSGYDISKELNSRVSQIEGFTFPLGAEMCLELSYQRDAGLKIAAVAVFLLVVILGVVKTRRDFGPVFEKIFLFLIIMCLVLFLIVVF